MVRCGRSRGVAGEQQEEQGKAPREAVDEPEAIMRAARWNGRSLCRVSFR